MIQQQETGAAPTMIQYTEFNKAFDFLNGALFGGSFPRFWSLSAESPGCWVTTLRQVGADQQPRGPGRRDIFQPRHL